MKKIIIIITLICSTLLFALHSFASVESYEAESASVGAGAKISAVDGASGGMAVVLDNGSVTFRFSVEKTDRYMLRVGYRHADGTLSADIDGIDYEIGNAEYNYGTRWVIVTLQAGEHTVTYRSKGEFIVDFLTVTPESESGMGGDSDNDGTDGPYDNPETSDVSSVVWISLSGISAITGVGALMFLKRH